jgi:hypothetical protein
MCACDSANKLKVRTVKILTGKTSRIAGWLGDPSTGWHDNGNILHMKFAFFSIFSGWSCSSQAWNREKVGHIWDLFLYVKTSIRPCFFFWWM